MSTLQFLSYSFASLPSGIYLFFPARGQEASPSAPSYRDGGDDGKCSPERVVVSTAYVASNRVGVGGMAARNTLYVDLDSSDFELLLHSLRPERNFRENPVTFSFEIGREDALTRVTIDERAVGPYDVSSSGIPPAMSA